ncbi:hypothetical protein G6F32_015504 [Rhizopus arrhizus]|nr:hypothetical protein G6F32_015504 [Rhizopus arrhizus]
MAVAHGLAHGHHVRDHAIALKSPPVGAHPGKAALHFVGDEQAAAGAHALGRQRQRCAGSGVHAVAGEHGVDHQRDHWRAGGFQLVGRSIHAGGELRRDLVRRRSEGDTSASAIVTP